MECNRRIRIKYGIPVDKRYVFSLSALEPRKNLIFAIRNFVKFIEQNHIDDLVFVIAGCINNDFEEVFNAELSKFGKNSTKVIKTGHVENDALAPLYSHAECCVFVSLYEGFGLPPLEAMQCGCPVIASNVTSIPEVVGSAGILIDPTNDEAMIAAYEKIYYGEELRKELSKKGIERAKNFSWKACVDVMVREFKKHDFKQPRSSCIISIPQCSILQALKRFFKKFIFDISNRPTKTKMMMFCFEIFKIKRKYKEKIFYVFGIPIFKKKYKSVIVH
jgi:glycosyltransferase involved in cell wall biosynthesis